MIKLEVNSLSRFFGFRRIFKDVSFRMEEGQSLAIVGPNGSGKTTLIKTIIGLIPATDGETIFSENDLKLDFDKYRRKLCLVAPYLQLYDNLTGHENLRFLTKIDGNMISQADIDDSLNRVGLKGRGDDYVSAYSTGMKQRLKYALAILRKPKVWFIDEPTANLDEDGKKIVFDIINEVRQDSIVLLATNEKEEYALADQVCQLGG